LLQVCQEVGSGKGEFPIVLNSGNGQGGRQEVNDVGGFVDDFTRLDLQTFGPVNNAGGSDAAFMIKMFVHPPGSVGGIGPAGTDTVKGSGLSHFIEVLAFVEDVLVAGFDVESEGIPFDGGSVVGSENNESVIEFPLAFQVSNDSADLSVHSVDHGGVDGHAPGKVEAAVFGQRFPCWIGPGLGFAIVSPGRAGSELGFRWNDFHLLHALEPFFAKLVPTAMILVGILGDILFECMQGEVRSVVGEVQKPGFVGCLPG